MPVEGKDCGNCGRAELSRTLELARSTHVLLITVSNQSVHLRLLNTRTSVTFSHPRNRQTEHWSHRYWTISTSYTHTSAFRETNPGYDKPSFTTYGTWETYLRDMAVIYGKITIAPEIRRTRQQKPLQLRVSR